MLKVQGLTGTGELSPHVFDVSSGCVTNLHRLHNSFARSLFARVFYAVKARRALSRTAQPSANSRASLNRRDGVYNTRIDRRATLNSIETSFRQKVISSSKTFDRTNNQNQTVDNSRTELDANNFRREVSGATTFNKGSTLLALGRWTLQRRANERFSHGRTKDWIRREIANRIRTIHRTWHDTIQLSPNRFYAARRMT